MNNKMITQFYTGIRTLEGILGASVEELLEVIVEYLPTGSLTWIGAVGSEAGPTPALFSAAMRNS